MTPDELALALEEKRPEMLRITCAMLRRSGMEAEAEDFLQDATIKILAGLAEDRYTFEEGVGGLFQTAIINLIHDRRAKEYTKERTANEYTRIYQPDSQAHIRQRERLNLDVALALEKLPDDFTRAAVRLVWMEEESQYRAAKHLRVRLERLPAALDLAKPILQTELARYDHRQRPASIPAEDRCLTSQPAYKKEDDETSESTALQAALFGDGPGETWPCPPIPDSYGDYQDHSLDLPDPVEEADAA